MRVQGSERHRREKARSCLMHCFIVSYRFVSYAHTIVFHESCLAPAHFSLPNVSASRPFVQPYQPRQPSPTRSTLSQEEVDLDDAPNPATSVHLSSKLGHAFQALLSSFVSYPIPFLDPHTKIWTCRMDLGARTSPCATRVLGISMHPVFMPNVCNAVGLHRAAHAR